MLDCLNPNNLEPDTERPDGGLVEALRRASRGWAPWFKTNRPFPPGIDQMLSDDGGAIRELAEKLTAWEDGELRHDALLGWLDEALR